MNKKDELIEYVDMLLGNIKETCPIGSENYYERILREIRYDCKSHEFVSFDDSLYRLSYYLYMKDFKTLVNFIINNIFEKLGIDEFRVYYEGFLDMSKTKAMKFMQLINGLGFKAVNSCDEYLIIKKI